MGAVKQYHRGAGALIVGLVNVQIAVLDVQCSRMQGIGRSAEPFSGEDAIQGGGDVQVERIAELILLGGAVGFNAGGLEAGVMLRS